MSRLIDADDLIAEIIECKRSFVASPNSVSLHDLECDGAIAWIDGAPTIDAVPVVHGRWVDGKCSVCKECNPTNALNEWTLELESDATLPYCPYCGARMDGDER